MLVLVCGPPWEKYLEAARVILPNVVLTSHIAGSQGSECRRLGRLVVDELRRYVAGELLQHEITRERAALMA